MPSICIGAASLTFFASTGAAGARSCLVGALLGFPRLARRLAGIVGLPQRTGFALAGRRVALVAGFFAECLLKFGGPCLIGRRKRLVFGRWFLRVVRLIDQIKLPTLIAKQATNGLLGDLWL
jgi:hypothetical protein